MSKNHLNLNPLLILSASLLVLLSCHSKVKEIGPSSIKEAQIIELMKVSSAKGGEKGQDDELDFELNGCLKIWDLYSVREVLFSNVLKEDGKDIDRMILVEYGTASEGLAYFAVVLIERNDDLILYRLRADNLGVLPVDKLELSSEKLITGRRPDFIDDLADKITHLTSYGCSKVPGQDGGSYFITYYDKDRIVTKMAYWPDYFINIENEEANAWWETILKIHEFIDSSFADNDSKNENSP